MTEAADFAETDRLSALEVEDADLTPPSPEMDQERRVAVYDLLESARLRPRDGAAVGPFALTLTPRGRKLGVRLQTADGAEAAAADVALSALATPLGDYVAVCASYFDAVKRLAPSQIEAVDKERRALHEDGSAALAAALAPVLAVDHDTAKRLFTLLAALRGPTMS